MSTLTGVNDPHSQRVQISCYALTYDGAQALANAAHDALEGNGYQAYRTDLYQASTKIHSVIVDWNFIE